MSSPSNHNPTGHDGSIIENFLDLGRVISINGLPGELTGQWLNRLGAAIAAGQPFLGIPTQQAPVKTITLLSPYDEETNQPFDERAFMKQISDEEAHIKQTLGQQWSPAAADAMRAKIWTSKDNFRFYYSKFDTCKGLLHDFSPGTFVVIHQIGIATSDPVQGMVKRCRDNLQDLSSIAEERRIAIVVDHPGLESSTYALHELLVDTYLRFDGPVGPEFPDLYGVSFRADYVRKEGFQLPAHAGDIDLMVDIQTGEVIEVSPPFDLVTGEVIQESPPFNLDNPVAPLQSEEAVPDDLFGPFQSVKSFPDHLVTLLQSEARTEFMEVGQETPKPEPTDVADPVQPWFMDYVLTTPKELKGKKLGELDGPQIVKLVTVSLPAIKQLEAEGKPIRPDSLKLKETLEAMLASPLGEPFRSKAA